jgi:hypothetical protein
MAPWLYDCFWCILSVPAMPASLSSPAVSRANVGRHHPKHAFIEAQQTIEKGGFRLFENSFGVGTESGI